MDGLLKKMLMDFNLVELSELDDDRLDSDVSVWSGMCVSVWVWLGVSVWVCVSVWVWSGVSVWVCGRVCLCGCGYIGVLLGVESHLRISLCRMRLSGSASSDRQQRCSLK